MLTLEMINVIAMVTIFLAVVFPVADLLTRGNRKGILKRVNFSSLSFLMCGLSYCFRLYYISRLANVENFGGIIQVLGGQNVSIMSTFGLLIFVAAMNGINFLINILWKIHPDD